MLDKFFRWLKPHDFLVLVIPDRNTVFGFLTRITPFWFHVLFYKYVMRSPNAGKPAHAPFSTFYDRVVSMQGIREYIDRHGHRIHLEYACKPDTHRIFGVTSSIFEILSKFGEVVSFGRLASNHSALIYVIEKSK